MSAAVGCFASFTLSELPQARVLASTLRRVHPDWVLHALLMDQLPPGLDGGPLTREFDQVVMADRLAIPDLQRWLFGHEQAAACQAVKGQMLVEMLADGFDHVVCLDATTAVFAPVTFSGDASIVLTPRLTSPATAQDELRAVTAGVYDPGFLAVRNDDVGRGFAQWWADRLHDGQLGEHWADLVPSLFDRVHVDRGLGSVTDAAADRRGLAFDGGALSAGGRPVRLFRFAAAAEADCSLERYELHRWYARALAAHALPSVPVGYWSYGIFSNGVAIPGPLRTLYRARPDLMAAFPDPFDAAGLHGWAQAEGLA